MLINYVFNEFPSSKRYILFEDVNKILPTISVPLNRGEIPCCCCITAILKTSI